MIYKIKNKEIVFDIRDEYYTDKIVIDEIWKENVYEVDDGRFSVDGTTVDLGANIGAFSILSASYGCKVLAVEPEPHNVNALINNIAINNMQDRITVASLGVSDFNGTAKIGNNGGGASIKDSSENDSIVSVITLDELFLRYSIDKVNILKIDVEGSETEIILGASIDSLNKCAYITMEFDIRTGKKMGEIVAKLSETHHVRTMGSWERGGMIWAWIY
jgi:FkbM family methyltransferase